MTWLRSTGRRTFAALRHRNYRLYFAGQAVSNSGKWMQSIAQAWLVLELTGSGIALGAVTALQFVPVLLFGPWGGLIADRFDKRRLLFATQVVASVQAVLLGVLTVTGAVELWMVYALAVVFGFVNAIDQPARQTFVLEMVGPEEVANAVSLNSVVMNAARAVGPGVAGVLIATVGIGVCFLVNGVAYVAVLVALVAMRAGELHPARRAPRGKGQLVEGFRYVWSSPPLRTSLLMMAAIGMLAYEFTVSLPLLAERTFGAGAGGLGAMTSVMGVGAVVGGLATASQGPPTPERLTRAGLVFGGLVLAVAASPTLPVALVVLPFMGAASIRFVALANATLQLTAAPEMRGRVMALFTMAFIGTTPIGGPLVGWLGETFGARSGLAVGGLAALAAAAYGHDRLVRNPAALPGAEPVPAVPSVCAATPPAA